MRKQIAMAAFAVFVASFVGSCAHAQQVYKSQTAEHTSVMRLWVQDDPLLPKRAVLNGCRYWEPKGVLCILVSKPEHALVRVFADPVKCGEGESKIEASPAAPSQPGCTKLEPATPASKALAEAWPDEKKIVVYTSCTSPDKQVDIDELTLTLAHEIGHQIGIWDHVPTVCNACGVETKIHPDGRKLCGEGAVMNSSHASGVTELTDLDAMAFDLRNRDYSALEPLDNVFFSVPAKRGTKLPAQHRP